MQKKNEENTPEKDQVQERYTVLGNSWDETDPESASLQEKSVQELKSYTYFDGDKIFQSLQLPAKAVKGGEALYKNKKITIRKIGERI